MDLSRSRVFILPMSTAFRDFRWCGFAVALVSAGVAVTSPLSAAGNDRKQKDAAPVLLSRTGGGTTWADLKELEGAVALGNPHAEAGLGEMLLRGDGVAKDPARGVALLEKAARAGHSGAAFRLGMLHAKGEAGLPRDYERSRAYFRAAAAGGEAEAFFNIGAAYASARGVRRDYAEALGWLIVARQRGADASAENSLRAQIKSRRDWIATGERRALEIEKEFTGRTVVEFLPSSATGAKEAPPKPEPPKPKFDLAPSPALAPPEPTLPSAPLKPFEPPKPTFTLPPP